MASLIGKHLAEVHHVIVPTGEGRREHAVEVRLNANIVAVFCTVGHPMGLDVLAFVAVLDHAGFAAVIFVIREPGDEHTSRQGIKGVRADDSAGILDEGVDGFDETGLAGFAATSKTKILLSSRPPEPEITTVIGEPAVMGFVATTDRDAGNHFAILIRSFGIGTNSDKFV